MERAQSDESGQRCGRNSAETWREASRWATWDAPASGDRKRSARSPPARNEVTSQQPTNFSLPVRARA